MVWDSGYVFYFAFSGQTCTGAGGRRRNISSGNSTYFIFKHCLLRSLIANGKPTFRSQLGLFRVGGHLSVTGTEVSTSCLFVPSVTSAL